MRNRHLISLIAALALPAALSYAYHTTLNLPPLPVWLLMVNLVLFALLGKDKFAARHKKNRTPEFTLLLLTFLGATPALLIGRQTFRHKTAKPSFVYAMWGTIAAQAACAWYFWPQLYAWL